MASFVVDNNVESTVADNPLAQASTTLNVAAGEGANFPSTFPFRLTIWDDSTYPDPTDDSGMEIVECTARATDALTIARGKEGTGDVAHANGERVAILITAGLFNDATYGITTKLDGIEASATIDQTDDEIRTANGRDMATFQMGHNILNMMTDPRLLILGESDPSGGVGGCKDWSGNGHDGDYVGSMVAGDRVNRGVVYGCEYNGSSQYVSFGDHDDFAFGDGAADHAFTFSWVAEQDGTAASRTFFAVHGNAPASERQYHINLDTSHKLACALYDGSANAHIGQAADTATSTGIHLFTVTYDATEANTGIKLYVDGELVASTGTSNNVYTAMHNYSRSLHMGNSQDYTTYFSGELGCAFMDGSEWNAAKIWQLWLEVKGKYGL